MANSNFVIVIAVSICCINTANAVVLQGRFKFTVNLASNDVPTDICPFFGDFSDTKFVKIYVDNDSQDWKDRKRNAWESAAISEAVTILERLIIAGASTDSAELFRINATSAFENKEVRLINPKFHNIRLTGEAFLECNYD